LSDQCDVLDLELGDLGEGSVISYEFLAMTYPVRVIDDDSVRNLEIQSKTTSSCGKNEDEKFGIGVEILQQGRSIVGFCAPVEAEVFVSTVQQEILHDIHNLRHLEEHQDLPVSNI